MKSLSLALIFAVCAVAAPAGAEDIKFPFEKLHSTFFLLKSFKIAEEDFVPCYVKAEKAEDKFDPVEARFRLLSPDGEERVLKYERIDDCRLLKDDEIAKSSKEDGFEYVLWLPKNAGAFAKGEIVKSTSVRLTLSIGRDFSGSASVGGKK